MKKFYFEGNVYNIEYFNPTLHLDIKCEVQECRAPIRYVAHPSHPYFRIVKGYEHSSNCNVCSDKTKKGISGNKKPKRTPYSGNIYWNYGLISNNHKENKKPYKPSTNKESERKVNEYSLEDSFQPVKKNFHIKNLKDVKTLINKYKETWKDIPLLINNRSSQSLYSKILPFYSAIDISKEKTTEKIIIIGKITTVSPTLDYNNLLLVLDNSNFKVFIPNNISKNIDQKKIKAGNIILVEGFLSKFSGTYISWNQISLRSNNDIEVLNIDYNYLDLFLDDPITKNILKSVNNNDFFNIDINNIEEIVNIFIRNYPLFTDKQYKIKNRFNLLIKEEIIKSISSPLDEKINIIVITEEVLTKYKNLNKLI